MNESIWNKFGLRGNPYDTNPLIEGNNINVENAFVGRSQEISSINKILSSFDEGNICILGKAGVGKTTLANHVKYNWKSKRVDKVLFSARTELEANIQTLNKRSFIFEILSSLYREIKLIEPKLAERDVMPEIRALIDLGRIKEMSGNLAVNLATFVQIGITKSASNILNQPLEIPDSALVDYLRQLIDFIRSHEIGGIKYSGVIIHMNNFDVVMHDVKNYPIVLNFFNEIRDIMQIRYTYFIFLGPPDLFSEIISKHTRVKAIFNQPLALIPLKKTELVDALTYRIEALKSQGTNPINPFTDEVIFKLYEIYEGDTRTILKALSDIVIEAGETNIGTLGYMEALHYLANERLSKLRVFLTPLQFSLLEKIIEKDGPSTQHELIAATGIAANNMAGYYFKEFKKHEIIKEISKESRTKYWDLTEHYLPLREYYKNRKNLETSLGTKLESDTKLIQDSLF